MKAKALLGGLGSGVVLILLVYFFASPYFVRAGVDRLASSLPQGYALTHDASQVDFFSRTLRLPNFDLKFPTGDVLHANTLEISGGNPWIASLFLDAGTTGAAGSASGHDSTLAGRITAQGLRFADGPIDFSAGEVRLDHPRADLQRLLAPLPLRHAAAIAVNAPPDALGAGAQRIASVLVASGWSRLVAKDLSVTGVDPASRRTVSLAASSVEADDLDHGAFGKRTIDNLSVSSGVTRIAVSRWAAGAADHRAFWAAVAGGSDFAVAGQGLTGADQHVAELELAVDQHVLATIDGIDLQNLEFHGGQVAALDLAIKGAQFDPILLEQMGVTPAIGTLGYTAPHLDGDLSYRWDVATGRLKVNKLDVVLQDGGSLSVSGEVAGIAPGGRSALLTGKIVGLSAVYKDAGLTQHWIDTMSAATHRAPNLVRDAYIAWLANEQMVFQSDAPIAAAIHSLQDFLGKPVELRLEVKPASPVGLSDFDPSHPGAFTTRLGLTLTASPGPAP